MDHQISYHIIETEDEYWCKSQSNGKYQNTETCSLRKKIHQYVFFFKEVLQKNKPQESCEMLKY